MADAKSLRARWALGIILGYDILPMFFVALIISVITENKSIGRTIQNKPVLVFRLCEIAQFEGFDAFLVSLKRLS